VDCNEIGLLKLKVHWGGGGGKFKKFLGKGGWGRGFWFFFLLGEKRKRVGGGLFFEGGWCGWGL